MSDRKVIDAEFDDLYPAHMAVMAASEDLSGVARETIERVRKAPSSDVIREQIERSLR